METAHHRLPKCLFLRVIKANGRKDWSAIAVRDILEMRGIQEMLIARRFIPLDYLSHKRVLITERETSTL